MDIMEFEEFKEYVRDNISDYLMQYDIRDVAINNVVKNNGIILTGMVIRLEGENVCPNIYLESYYDYYVKGRDIEWVMQDIAGDYQEARSMLQSDYASDLAGINKSQLFLKAVNYRKNRDMLENTIYERYMDLALQVRVLVKNDISGVASTAVNYDMLELLGIGKTEAYLTAKNNTPEIFPVKCKSLAETIYELSGYAMDETENMMPPVYVVTNEAGINGAVYLNYPDIISEVLAEKNVDEDVYIIPSSIHELLVLPASSMQPQDVAGMVRDVNQTVVSDMDYLSDNIYRYDAEEKTITQITDVHNERLLDSGRETDR